AAARGAPPRIAEALHQLYLQTFDENLLGSELQEFQNAIQMLTQQLADIGPGSGPPPPLMNLPSLGTGPIAQRLKTLGCGTTVAANSPICVAVAHAASL